MTRVGSIKLVTFVGEEDNFTEPLSFIYETGTFIIDVSGYGFKWLVQVYALE